MLEEAAAQESREVGVRVSTYFHVHLTEFNNLHKRRLEVVADGLTLWHSARLTIDTTLVSSFHRDGLSGPGRTTVIGFHWVTFVVANLMATEKGTLGGLGCGGWRQVERRVCQILGQFGEGEGTGFFPCVAGQGPTGFHQEVERSSGLFSSARVLCFFAGPPSSTGSRGHPFSE